MEENLEDIATGGKLNASLPGYRPTEDAKHDMIITKETSWDSYKSHVFSCYAKTIFETTSTKITIQPVPEQIQKIYIPLKKQASQYRYKSATKYVVREYHVKQITFDGDLFDSSYYTFDTFNGKIPESIFGPDPSNTYYIDSFGADTLYSASELLQIMAEQFRHTGDMAVIESLPRYVATSGFLVLTYGLSMEIFKHQTFLKHLEFVQFTVIPIIRDTSLQRIFGNWALPAFHQAYNKMPDEYKTEYKTTAAYLKEYLLKYNEIKIRKFLQENEPRFAYDDPYSRKPDPRRKLTAFIDRLVLKHHTINYEQAKKFIVPFCDAILSWE